MAAAVAEAAITGVIANSSSQTDSTLNNLVPSDRADTAAQDVMSSTDKVEISTAGSAMNEANETTGEPSISMHTDQMAMRLALDVLWTGGGSGTVKPAVQTPGSAESDAL